MIHSNKKVTPVALRDTIHKLKASAEKMEGVRVKLAIVAKKLAAVAKEKEAIRIKLALTAEQLAATASEKENVRRKLEIVTKEAENTRLATLNVLEDLQIEKVSLSRAKAKDEAMLASIGDGVLIIDPYARVTFINQAGLGLLGLTNAEVVGRSLFDIFEAQDEKGEAVPRELRPMTVAMITGMTIVQEGKENTAAGNKTIAGVFYYVRKDKTKFPVAVTVAPVIFENEIAGAIEVFRDITREIEIDQEKSEFVSLASHQLKTPPTAIKLLTERLLNNRLGELNPEQKTYIDNIRSSNQRMINIINALLSVSRIELGKFTIQPVKKDVCAIVKSVIFELAPLINNQKIELKDIYFKDSVMVPIDEILFRIIINNLIVNAIYYNVPNGTVQVECIQMNKGEDTGRMILQEDYFVVVVSDTGAGIPENQQDKIFTKFFRADNARAMHTDGTGLGLYIVKSILDNSGGLIWFSSQEDKGTSFSVAIPMAGMQAKTGTKELPDYRS